ncbi:MAG: hypothetical protein H0T75_10225 [Rhizobiales bacterium]|nr:hypothetical protein [Hyphomicrobiales bacterium]
MDLWLSAPTFGAVAGISRQKAHSALARAYAGKPWRGVALDVRMIQGARGGRSGRTYVLNPESLPEPYKGDWKAS